MGADPVLSIGNSQLHQVVEVRIPNTIAYFTLDDALIEANRHWLAPHFLDENNGFDLVFRSFIFEAGGRVVVLDLSVVRTFGSDRGVD